MLPELSKLRPPQAQKELNRDLACAIALGFVEAPGVAVTLESITLLNAQLQPLSTQANWLDDRDPLHAFTREYLAARREASRTSRPRLAGGAWESSASTRVRDQAVQRSVKARKQALELLIQRGVLYEAGQMGLRVTRPE